MRKLDIKKEIKEYSKYLKQEINNILISSPEMDKIKLEDLAVDKEIFHYVISNHCDEQLVNLDLLLKKGYSILFIRKSYKSTNLEQVIDLNKRKIKAAKPSEKDKIQALTDEIIKYSYPPGAVVTELNKKHLHHKKLLRFLKNKLHRFDGEVIYFAIDESKVDPGYLSLYFEIPLGKKALYAYQLDNINTKSLLIFKDYFVHMYSPENQRVIKNIEKLTLKIRKGVIDIQEESKFNPASIQIEEKLYEILKSIKKLTPAEKALQDISRDEAVNIEFKSSLELQCEKTKEFDVGARNINLIDSILKTMNAFLNSPNGGRLYIGIRDHDKKIIGIEQEIKKFHKNHKTKKPSQDRFELHFRQKIDDRLSKHSRQSISTSFIKIGMKTIYKIDVKHSKKVVFLDNEYLYERTGPRTVQVKGQRLKSFFKERD